MTRSNLTHRQQEFLDWITDHIKDTGKSPTMQELGEQFKMKPSSAFDLVKPLVAKGYLQRVGKGTHRQLELVDEDGTPFNPKELPIIGRVAAGMPILAVDNRIGSVLVSDRMLKRGATFALIVKGDSMIEAGILDGDSIIIRQTSDATPGSIVLAIVASDEATLKYYHPQPNGTVILRPANARMKDIEVRAEECSIQGVAIGLMREL